MKKHSMQLRTLAVTLMATLCLSSLAACQVPPEATRDTDGATRVEETTATGDVTDTQATTTEKTTEAMETVTVADTEAAETTPDTSSEETTDEVTTAEPDRELTVDSRYRIVVAADASDLIREAADKVAAAFKDKAGLELEIVTDAEPATAYELVLGDTNRVAPTYVDDYALFVNGDSIHMDASSHILLYHAVDAVMDTWLSDDFGLKEEGEVSLWLSRVIDLNGLSHEMTNSIKVMTLNMRNSNDPNGNSIPERYERFLKMLADYRPDIIGTQEHGSGWYLRLEKLFGKMTGEEDFPQYALSGESISGIGAKSGAKTCLLYRVDRFDLIDEGTFWLSETPDVSSALPGMENFKRICSWAILKDKQTGQSILALNTHLDHQSDSAREQQIHILLDYMKEKFGDYPVFFTGDFNSTSWEPAYTIVDERFDDAHETAPMNLSTVRGTYNGYISSGGGSPVDHIFHNAKSTPVTYEIISKDYDGFISDHYPVMAEFLLK